MTVEGPGWAAARGAGGVVEPVGIGGSRPAGPHFCHFTEPNVALSLQDRTADRARTRVHLAAEAHRPAPGGSSPPGISDDFVVVDATLEEFVAAADAWAADRQAFPVR